MKILNLGILSLILAVSLNSASAQQKQNDTSFRLIASPQNTFGYNIVLNGHIFIHQPTIPGMAGNTGFKTKEQAAQTAALVVSKIKSGMMPPTVSEEEIKKIVNK